MISEVKPVNLRQQVKRNIKRSPNDFMFQLTDAEAEIMVSHNLIPSQKVLDGHLPYTGRKVVRFHEIRSSSSLLAEKARKES